jgi:tetratricopeptide (TPR) repeat protein
LRPAWIAALCLLGGGCSQEPKDGTAGSIDLYQSSPSSTDESRTEESAASSDPAPASEVVEPPTPSVVDLSGDPAFRDFAEAWVRVHRDDDTLAAYELFDWDRFFDRATAGIDAAPSFKVQFLQRMRSLLQSSEGPQKAVAQRIRMGDDFRCIALLERGGAPAAVFRLLRANQDGVDFQVVEVTRAPGGRAAAVDVFFLAKGQKFSEEIRWRFLDALVMSGQTPPGVEASLYAASLKLSQMVADGRNEEAVAYYRTLPPMLRASKRCMVWLLQAARNVGPQTYLSSLEAYLQQFQGDPSTPMFEMEASVLRRNPQRLLTAIERLEESAAPDPYLETSKAFALVELGRSDEAEERVSAAIEAEPTLQNAYRVKLLVQAKGLRFKDMVETLRAYEKSFPASDQAATWLKDPAFAAFLASDEYREWSGASARNESEGEG